MKADVIIKEFGLKPFGQKGWQKGQLFCPECGKNDKFGILFTENSGVAKCFYCSIKIPLWKLLKDLGRGDLLEYNYEFSPNKTLPLLHKEKVIEEEKIVHLPIGYRRTNDVQYLRDRNFTDEQFEQFKVGVSRLDPHTKDMIIFEIYQKGILSGWLARSKNSKEWHHDNVKRHKQFGDPLVLRYRNSNNDFSKMLGGLDEITDNTHTVILVEGLFDKANLDRLMNLNNQEEIKCCYTFGSDLNVTQADLIPLTVERIILMYDKGTIHSMKEAGGRLMSLFDVQVALIKDPDIDPGNMDQKYLGQLLLNLKDFLYFYSQIESK